MPSACGPHLRRVLGTSEKRCEKVTGRRVRHGVRPRAAPLASGSEVERPRRHARGVRLRGDRGGRRAWTQSAHRGEGQGPMARRAHRAAGQPASAWLGRITPTRRVVIPKTIFGRLPGKGSPALQAGCITNAHARLSRACWESNPYAAPGLDPRTAREDTPRESARATRSRALNGTVVRGLRFELR